MKQELLQSICNTIISSEEPTTLSELTKMISANKDAILDSKVFYSSLLTSIANNLHVYYFEDIKKAIMEGIIIEYNKLDSLSSKKLNLFKKIIFDHPELDDVFYVNLIKLAGYNTEEVNKTIIEIANNENISCNQEQYLYEHNKDILRTEDLIFSIKKHLSWDIEQFSENDDLVLEVAKLGGFNRDKINSICYDIDKLNEEINALREELDRLSPEERLFNNILNKKRDINSEIKKISLKRNSLISVCSSIIAANGIENFDIDESVINTIAKSSRIGYDNYGFVDSYINSIFVSIKASDNTLKKLNLPKLVDNLEKQNLDYYAIGFLPFMSDEQLMQSKKLSSFVQKILSDKFKRESQKDFLQKLSDSDAIYSLYPETIIMLLEYIYSDKAENIEHENYDETVFTVVNEEKKLYLNARIEEIIQECDKKTNKANKFYEKLVAELLSKDYYDNLISEILQNKSLDLSYDVDSTRGPQSLSYYFCRESSPKILKDFLNVYESSLPIYISGHGYLEDINMCNIYLKVDNYDKSKEIFENPNFKLLSEYEASDLSKYGQYSISGEYYNYKDTLTKIAETIYWDESPEAIKVFEDILQSDKVGFVNLETLKYIMYLTDYLEDENSLFGIIKRRYNTGEIKFLKSVSEDDLSDMIENVRQATEEEIREVCPQLFGVNVKRIIKF